MPHYDFETDAGKPVELYFSMSAAPRVGEVIEQDGVRLTRVLSVTRKTDLVQREISGVVCHQAAAWAPGAKHYVRDKSSPDYGQPVMTSRKDIAHFLRSNPGATYGDGMSSIS